jgi:DNA-binding LytR/AlgR family response regulator
MFRSSETRPSAVVVEDEAPLRDELVDLLAERWPALEIAGCAADGAQALALIEREAPDVVFLDIRIPGPSGLAVAERVAERAHVVFVTAYDAHAIEAFEKGAVDYLLKPMTTDRLDTTIRRLQQRLAGGVAERAGAQPGAHLAVVAPTPKRPLRWITATVDKSTRFIAIDEVVYFQSDHKYTRVVLADAEYLIKRPLKDLLAELDPEQFWQIHRSTVVNILEVRAMEPDFSGRLAMRLRSRRELLPVSESFAARYRRL